MIEYEHLLMSDGLGQNTHVLEFATEINRATTVEAAVEHAFELIQELFEDPVIIVWDCQTAGTEPIATSVPESGGLSDPPYDPPERVRMNRTDSSGLADGVEPVVNDDPRDPCRSELLAPT